MAFCYNCGAKLPEGANFCFECGTKLDIEESAPEKENDVVTVIPVIAVENESPYADDDEDDDLDDDLGGYAAESAKIVPPSKAHTPAPAARVQQTAPAQAPAPTPAPAAPIADMDDEDDDDEDDLEDDISEDISAKAGASTTSQKPAVSEESDEDDDDDEDDYDYNNYGSDDDEDDDDEDDASSESSYGDSDDDDDDLDEDDGGSGTLQGAGKAPAKSQWIEQNGGYTPMDDPYWDDILPDLEKEIYQIPKDMIFKMIGSFIFMLVLIIWLVVML